MLHAVLPNLGGPIVHTMYMMMMILCSVVHYTGDVGPACQRLVACMGEAAPPTHAARLDSEQLRSMVRICSELARTLRQHSGATAGEAPSSPWNQTATPASAVPAVRAAVRTLALHVVYGSSSGSDSAPCSSVTQTLGGKSTHAAEVLQAKEVVRLGQALAACRLPADDAAWQALQAWLARHAAAVQAQWDAAACCDMLGLLLPLKITSLPDVGGTSMRDMGHVSAEQNGPAATREGFPSAPAPAPAATAEAVLVTAALAGGGHKIR